MVWKLAALNLFRNRTRSFLTLTAISFGCASLILAAGYIQDVITQMQESYIRAFLGHIRVVKKGFYEKGLLDPYAYMIPDASSLVQKISAFPGVIAATPRLEFPGLLSTGNSTIPFIAQAVEPDTEQRVTLNFVIRQGANLVSRDRYGVLLGRGIAETIQAKPGDKVTLLVTTARGGMNAMDVTVKGIFHTASKDFDDRAVRVVLATGQKLLRTNDVHTVTVFLAKTADTDRIRAQLRDLFQKDHLDLDAKPWYDLPEADFVIKVVPFYGVFFGVLQFIIVMMVIFGIFNTINTSVLERIGEIGTLGAIGTSRHAILKLFLAEGFLLGAFGAVVGVIGGVLLARLISWHGIRMPVSPGTTVRWTTRIQVVPSACVSAGVLVIIAAVSSTFYPALKAAKLDIAEALRHNI